MAAPTASPPPAAPAAASPPSCAQCGGPANERCAGCRSVHYCGRGCQKAAWPDHKALCKFMMAAVYGGRQLATERDFVLEFWAPLLPRNCDAGALLGPPGEPLDAAAAFERCRTAAMDDVNPGFARRSEAERDAAWDATCLLVAAGEPRVADIAATCLERLYPAALGRLLAAGVAPGAVAGGRSLLCRAVAILFTSPYAQSAAALPHALASLRALLAHARPSDWLVGPAEQLPLFVAACIPAPAAQAVLDAIVASPGGFPAHAVAASPGVLHKALQASTASFVAALLAAGADAAAMNTISESIDGTAQMRGVPLHALVAGSPPGDARDFGDKLRLLLGAGADLEAPTERAVSPLVLAAYSERLVAFDALLAAGARVSALRVNLGRDAAHFESVLHHLAMTNKAALIPRVLATGALDVDVRAGPARQRLTPLHSAAYNDAPQAVSALLAGGASLTATDGDGENALQLAIYRGSTKAARPLVAATPPAARARHQREAARVVAVHRRDAAARPGDAALAAKLAGAREIAALLQA